MLKDLLEYLNFTEKTSFETDEIVMAFNLDQLNLDYEENFN